MPLLQATASGVIARYEAIRRADNKQITKHVIGRSVATWQSSLARTWIASGYALAMTGMPLPTATVSPSSYKSDSPWMHPFSK
ncbi:MAG: hypothetical protein LBF85_01520 [Tannerella sp.]|nr:hypothetical protein [Tannerella sp.]